MLLSSRLILFFEFIVIMLQLFGLFSHLVEPSLHLLSLTIIHHDFLLLGDFKLLDLILKGFNLGQ
jgi:hypothetical protein